MVLTSTNKNIFCAGLDLLEMHNPEEQRLRAFWHTLQELWLRLYIFPKPTGAAIAGHSPAGGALMATCCDFRAMVASDKFTIGLNEAKFGLVAPFWFMDSFRNTVRNSHWGKKSSIYPKNQILTFSFLTKFTISKSHFSQKSQFLKPYCSHNSQFQSLIFHKIHIFQISNSR